MFLPDNSLCLIKVCAYSFVTNKQMAVVDYYIEVTLVSILIQKTCDSTKKSNRFFSQFSLQAFKGYICIHKEQKEPLIQENQLCVSSFFFRRNQLKE